MNDFKLQVEKYEKQVDIDSQDKTQPQFFEHVEKELQQLTDLRFLDRQECIMRYHRLRYSYSTLSLSFIQNTDLKCTRL